MSGHSYQDGFYFDSAPTVGVIIPPMPDPTLDRTKCLHRWGLMTGSYMVNGIVDYTCVACGAHGQREIGRPDIAYCHGGKL